MRLIYHVVPLSLLQVFVDEVSCIGCGKCVRACPAAFLLEDSKYGRARVVQGEYLRGGDFNGVVGNFWSHCICCVLQQFLLWTAML